MFPLIDLVGWYVQWKRIECIFIAFDYDLEKKIQLDA